jgi:uncharacterized protein (DUF1778 family)
MMTTATLPRITARIDINTQSLLLQAAAVTGMSSLNQFVLNAAIEKAKNILRQEQTLSLSAKDAQQLISALDAESQANPRLQLAVKRYRQQS